MTAGYELEIVIPPMWASGSWGGWATMAADRAGHRGRLWIQIKNFSDVLYRGWPGSSEGRHTAGADSGIYGCMRLRQMYGVAPVVEVSQVEVG